MFYCKQYLHKISEFIYSSNKDDGKMSSNDLNHERRGNTFE